MIYRKNAINPLCPEIFLRFMAALQGIVHEICIFTYLPPAYIVDKDFFLVLSKTK